MRYSGKELGWLGVVLLLVFGLVGCHGLAPYPSHSSFRRPYYRPMVRVKHHYRYYPENRIYYDTTRKIYFYQNNDIWLSAPLLPGHLHLNLDYYEIIDLDDPKPFIYHHDTIKRYPPGLRQEKHRKQRDNWRDDRGERRDRSENRQDRPRDREKERVKPEKERKRGKSDQQKNRKEETRRPAIWK